MTFNELFCYSFIAIIFCFLISVVLDGAIHIFPRSEDLRRRLKIDFKTPNT